MSKAKKAKPPANVVDLAAFRQTRTASMSASQGAPPGPIPGWTHVEAAPWCLWQFDKEPVVAAILNDWEVNFLEDMAAQEWPATERQIRALNRIIYIVTGVLQDLERNSPNPPPDDTA